MTKTLNVISHNDYKVDFKELKFSYSGFDDEIILLTDYIESYTAPDSFILRFFSQRLIPSEFTEKP